MKGRVLFASDHYLSHPVLQEFGPDLSSAVGSVSPDQVDAASLVVVDCRPAEFENLTAVDGPTQLALAADKPLLLLSPSRIHLKSLEGSVGILPTEPSEAILVRSRAINAGIKEFEVDSLAYPAAPDGSESAEALSRQAEDEGREVEVENVYVKPFSKEGVAPALDRFLSTVYLALEGAAFAPTDQSPPTGLKYFKHTLNAETPFTYKVGGTSNGTGSVSLSWTVWGFLEQTQSDNSQFLVVKTSHILNPGRLHANDSKDRGFANSHFRGNLNPPLNAFEYRPSDATCNTFSGSVSIPISYKSPIGGYQIWNFEDSISDNVSDWCVKSNSSGNSLGSTWYMNKPVNGTNISHDWKGAFTTSGHVHGLPGGSTGSLDVDSISTWQNDTLLTGYQSVAGNYGWQGVRFHGSSCSPGVCWKLNEETAGVSWPQGFHVDFTLINP